MKIKDVSICVGLVSIYFMGLMVGRTNNKESGKCVNIFYDQSQDPSYVIGKKFSMKVQNLLASFSQHQLQPLPIETYQEGDMDKCSASIYIGSYIDNKLPRAFLNDYIRTEKKVAWIGHNIWQLGEQLEKSMGLRFIRLTTLDSRLRDHLKRPTFFAEILYNGKVFFKSISGERHGEVVPPYEQAELLPTDLSKFEVIAEARHTGTREVIPYIVRAQNRYYVADNPFAYKENSLISEVFRSLFYERHFEVSHFQTSGRRSPISK